MENLTLNEMNEAYMALVNTYGDQLITKQDGLKLFITLNSNCNTGDNTALIIDQKICPSMHRMVAVKNVVVKAQFKNYFQLLKPF